MLGQRIEYACNTHRICSEYTRIWLDSARKCKEYVWNMYGIRIEYTWNMHEYAWNMQGICMDYPWKMLRICMSMHGMCEESACDMHGIHLNMLGILMNMLGLCKAYVWNMHGMRIESAWKAHAWNTPGICFVYTRI